MRVTIICRPQACAVHQDAHLVDPLVERCVNTTLLADFGSLSRSAPIPAAQPRIDGPLILFLGPGHEGTQCCAGSAPTYLSSGISGNVAAGPGPGGTCKMQCCSRTCRIVFHWNSPRYCPIEAGAGLPEIVAFPLALARQILSFRTTAYPGNGDQIKKRCA